MMKNLFLFGFVALLAACGGSNEVEMPTDIIDAHKFTAILIDVQLTEGMNSQVNYMRHNFDKKKKLDPYQPIFEKHNVNSDEFKRTYAFYSEHPKKMELLYEQVLDSLSKLDAEIKQKYTQDERAKSDSIRVSNQRRVDSIRGMPRLLKNPEK